MDALPVEPPRSVLDFTVLLAGLNSLVGSDRAALTYLDLRTHHEVAVFWPAPALSPDQFDAYRALGHTHPLRGPLRQLVRTRPSRTRPVRTSDLLTTRAWRQSPLCREAMRDTADQLCLPLSFHRTAVRALTLTRSSGAFTDRQRDLVTTLAPLLHPAAAGLAPAPRRFALSTRERAVLSLVAQGLTDAQVARRLGVAPATVSKHLHRVYTRLGVPNRAAAVRHWLSGSG